MNTDQLKQAAEVMRRAAEGEVVVTRTGNTDGWIVVNPVWDWCKNDYGILGFPSPPSGQSWHNPVNLNATQVGVHEGWRLCLENEQTPWGLAQTLEVWDGEKWVMWGTNFAKPAYTFRTKSPLPEANADPCKAAWEAEFDPRMYPHCDVFEAWFRKGWQACEKHRMAKK